MSKHPWGGKVRRTLDAQVDAHADNAVVRPMLEAVRTFAHAHIDRVERRAADLQTPTAKVAALTNLNEIEDAAAATTRYSVYAADGYDAYRVGCSDIDCPKLGGNSLPGYAIGLIAAGCVATVAFVGVLYYKRRQRSGYQVVN